MYSFPYAAEPKTASDITPEFLARKGSDREEFIFRMVQEGHVPDFLRISCRIEVTVDVNNPYYLEVAPDYLCLGTDEDFMYAQCTARTAQRVCDLIGAMLPTPRMVDLVWLNARGRFEPRPQGGPYDHSMASSERLVRQSLVIQADRGRHGAPLGALVAGHAKDYVLSPKTPKGKTCIYGWHQLTGGVIQPVNARSHALDYVDYSQMARFVVPDLYDGDGNVVVSLPEVFQRYGRSPLMVALAAAPGPYPTRFG